MLGRRPAVRCRNRKVTTAMILAGLQDYLFPWQLWVILFYAAAWLIGGTYLMRWALVRMTDLPRRKRTLSGSFRLNFFTTGSGLAALALIALAFGMFAGRAESGKLTIAVTGLALSVPAMFGTAWAVGMVLLSLSAKAWLRVTAVATGGPLAFLVLLVAVAFVPSRSQRLTNLYLGRCEKNLYGLRGALNRHGAIGPEAATLEELVEKGQCGPELLRCPAKPDRVPGYLYVPSPQTARDAGAAYKIRACDRRGNHGSSRMVLYTDGRVKAVNEDRFAELLTLPDNAKMAELVRAEQ